MQALCLLIETSLLFFYLPSPTSSCKSSIQMSFSFCLYCGFFQTLFRLCLYRFVTNNWSKKGMRDDGVACGKDQLPLKRKYIVIIITTITPKYTTPAQFDKKVTMCSTVWQYRVLWCDRGVLIIKCMYFESNMEKSCLRSRNREE